MSLGGSNRVEQTWDAPAPASQEWDAALLSLAHDVKTQLAIVKGLAQFLGRQVNLEATDRAGMIDGLGGIASAASRTERLMEAVIDTASYRAGRETLLFPARVELVRLARGIVEDYRRLLPYRAFSFTTTDKEIFGWWDANQLGRVLDNLLSNAAKYSHEGSPITIRLTRDGRTESAAGTARLSVRDEGIGIPARDLPHVFNWFYRSAEASNLASGTGIGLALAQHILDAHGGTIAVSSEEECWTEVTICLPLGKED